MVNYTPAYVPVSLSARVLKKYPEIPADVLQDFAEAVHERLEKVHWDNNIRRFSTRGLDLEDPCDLLKVCSAMDMSDDSFDEG